MSVANLTSKHTFRQSPLQLTDRAVVSKKVTIIKNQFGPFSKDSENLIQACLKIIESKLGGNGKALITSLTDCFTERCLANENSETKEDLKAEIKRLQTKIENIGIELDLLFKNSSEQQRLSTNYFNQGNEISTSISTPSAFEITENKNSALPLLEKTKNEKGEAIETQNIHYFMPEFKASNNQKIYTREEVGDSDEDFIGIKIK